MKRFTFSFLSILSIAFIFSTNTSATSADTTAHFGQGELSVIKAAADRNGCAGDLYTVLLSIRKSEAGPKGTEFGVLHPRAANTNLDTQAGWAAATVRKNFERYTAKGGDPNDIPAYIHYLSNVYCPSSADPIGHENWVRNVTHWYQRLS